MYFIKTDRPEYYDEEEIELQQLHPKLKPKLSLQTRFRMKFGKKRRYQSNIVKGICNEVLVSLCKPLLFIKYMFIKQIYFSTLTKIK